MHARHDDFNSGILLGIALSFLPKPLLEYGMDAVMRRMNASCPNLRKRLAAANGKRFALMIADMPFNLLLSIKNGLITATPIGKQEAYSADVVIHSISQKLLALLDGSEDGDALFFSRDLQVAGDTEALLILRNALDSERINIREICYSVFGPLSGIAKKAGWPLEALALRFVADVRAVHGYAVAPLVRRQQELSQHVQAMERRLSAAENHLARRTTRKAIGNES